MNRVVPAFLVLLGLVVVAPLADASHAGFQRALKPYISRLTADLGFLANLTDPSKQARGRLLHVF